MYLPLVRGSVDPILPEEDGFLLDDSFFDSLVKTSEVALSELKQETNNQCVTVFFDPRAVFDSFDPQEFAKHIKPLFSEDMQPDQAGLRDGDGFPARIRAKL